MLLKLKIISKTKSQFKNLAKYFNRYIRKERIQMANKQIKRCSISLVMREMQIKAPLKYYSIYMKTAKIKKLTT